MISEVFSARGAVTISLGGGSQTVTGRGLWVGGAGTVVVTMMDGSTATLQGVPAGTIFPITFTAVSNTSTATLMVALI